MSDNDPRFPSNVDQRYITWPEYERFHTGSNSGPAPVAGFEDDNSPHTEPISQEELRRRAEAAAELDIQDQAEQTRRNIIYHFQVEEGQSWPESFATMIRMERDYIKRVRNKNPSPFEIATANYILQNPLQDINDWASRQGNRWCVNLNKAVEKKAGSRKTKPAVLGLAVPDFPAPPDPQVLATAIIRFFGLAILAAVAWYLYQLIF